MTAHRSLLAIAAGCVLSVLLIGRDVHAQPSDGPPRTQVGGSAGFLFFLPTFGGRLSVPLRSLSLEVAGDYVPLTVDDDGAVWLLFQAQLRHRLNRGQAWRMHATYGATLFATYIHRREFRQSRPDGSAIVFPEYRRMQIVGPPGLHAGVGAERPLSDRVVARWDMQALVAISQTSIPVPRVVFGIAWQRGPRR